MNKKNEDQNILEQLSDARKKRQEGRPCIKRNYGNIYGMLRTHKAVDAFAFELSMACDFPEQYHPILVSIGEQLLYKKGYISNKQICLALKLINERDERR
jgi:hypothetical protein